MRNSVRNISLILWLLSIFVFFTFVFISNHSIYFGEKIGGYIGLSILFGVLFFMVLVITLFLEMLENRAKVSNLLKKQSINKTNFTVTFSVLHIIIIILIVVGVLYLFFQNIYNTSEDYRTTDEHLDFNTLTCDRTDPYTLAPEFERARSFRIQRYIDSGLTMNNDFYNCINIVYSDLSSRGASGLFIFDDSSDIQNLTIYVDISYKYSDDLLTAILLSHEFEHVSQYLHFLKTGEELDCMQKEVDAFSNQLFFIWSLNEEEKQSLFSRINTYNRGLYGNSRMVSEIGQLDTLLDIGAQSYNFCKKQYVLNTKEFDICRINTIKELITSMVYNSDFYQRQCQ